MMRISSEHPPGMIGIVSNTMGRYREFDMSVNTVYLPRMSQIRWATSCDVARNYNNLCKMFLKDENLKWLWILGDDHVFKRNTLINLLNRKVDIVVPLCLQRTPPFNPVVYTVTGDQHFQVTCKYFNNKKNLIEVDACGNAGMLIQRHVIAALENDWFKVGWLEPDVGSSDLYFCKRARSSGYKIFVDLNNPIGHINHMAVWPIRNTENEYSVGIGSAMEYPDTINRSIHNDNGS